MPRQFSLAYLTIPGIDPMEQIRIAGAAGYDYVSLRTIPMGLPGEFQLVLEKDPQMFKAIREQMERCNVKLLDIELVRIREDLSSDFRAAFEAGASLGAKHVLSSVWTKDFDFAAKQYEDICRQAAEFGLDVNLEYPVVSAMPSFNQVVALQEKVGAPNLKIFVDTLHSHYDHVTGEQIKSIAPERYGIIHLCDCPNPPEDADLLHVVREAREYCGYGQANVVELIRALPKNPCSIELPNLKYIEQYGAEGHARRCLETAKALFYTEEL